MKNLPPEYLVVEAVCRHLLGEPLDVLDQLISSPGFSWGDCLFQSIRHRQAASVSHFLESRGLGRRMPSKIRDAFNDLKNMAAYRASVYENATLEVAEGLRAAGVRFAVRKGLATRRLLFDPPHLRVFDDLDLVLDESQSERSVECLNGLNFVKGHFDFGVDDVVPIPREEAIRYRLSPDHIPRLTRRTKDPLIRNVDLDIALSLTWTGADYKLPVQAALESVRPIDVGPLAQCPRLSDEYLFLDCVMHMFREAFLEIDMASGKDVTLAKNLEVCLLWRRLEEGDRAQGLRALIRQHELERPVAWVAAHVDSVFQQGVLPALGLQVYVDDEFLGAWRASGGQMRRWSGTMRERLASLDRSQLLGRATPVARLVSAE